MHSRVGGVRITGVGVVSAAGELEGTLWQNIVAGRSGIARLRRLVDAGPGIEVAAEIDGGSLGLDMDGTSHGRSTLFGIKAVANALSSAGLRIGHDVAPEEVGIALGTSFANLDACVAFCDSAVAEGWRGLRPTLFPNTMITTPAGQIAIYFKLRGPNATLSTGQNAGLDALAFGMNQIARNRAKVMIVGGVEELSPLVVEGFAQAGLLACSSDGSEAVCAPYDERANGIVLGEGAAMLVIEERDFARQRRAGRQLRIAGLGTASSDSGGCFGSGDPGALESAMVRALKTASIRASDIDCVFGSADSGSVDQIESRAIQAVFRPLPPVSTIKGITGECLGASPVMQLCAAAMALREGTIPAVGSHRRPGGEVRLRSIVTETTFRQMRNIMVNAVGWEGSARSVIISDEAAERPVADPGGAAV